MMKIGWNTRQPKECSTRAMAQRIFGGVVVALLLAVSAKAYAQTPLPSTEGEQHGYIVHHTAELGGRIADVSGSGAMYDTLVNLHSGPRVLGQTFTMKPLDSLKHPLFDSLTAFSSGFGGDPNNVAKLDFSKAKLYEFSGLFRRDRQYFDYNLLGSVNLPAMTVPYGMVSAGVPTAASFALTGNPDSNVMFNTVRGMTDTSLTLLPLSVFTIRVGYVQSIFQGPTITPGRPTGITDRQPAG